MTIAVSVKPVPQGAMRTALRLLRLAALVTAVMLPLSLTLFWVLLDERGTMALLPSRVDAALSLGYVERALGLVLSMIPVGILIFGLVRLRAYVAALLDGDIFSSSAAGALRDFAIAIGASALIKPFVAALVSVAITWSALPGQRMLSLQLSSETLLSVLFAGTIALGAWSMQQAAKIAEENAQFV